MSSFLETVEKARVLLERNGKISLRALRREFDLEDDALEELVEELVDIQEVALREGRALVWARGAVAPHPADTRPPPAPERSPRDYTPKHLAEKILRSKATLEGERKQVSVLFADVKGSLELAEQVDPEDWHGILDRFFQILTEGVHRFEGTVNQYTGDGIMALFGAPIAHEDHAQRACYAALHLRRELRAFANELRRERGLSFSTRVGINSGEVVVGKIGDDLRMDYTAQGHTVGLAARMEELAEPGTTYLTAHTARLVDGFFRLRDLGEFAVKGVSERLPVFELDDVGELRTRLDRSRARGFSRFVGRADELVRLERAFAQTVEGRGQVVGVVGHAGLGKSRICYEFVEARRREGVRVIESHSPPHGKSVPLHATLQLLRAFFGVTDRDSPEDVRTRVAGTLSLLGAGLRDELPLLFDFLGVPDAAFPVPDLDPDARERRLFAFMRALESARGEREPTIVFLDDLHWIDASSDAFLANQIDALDEARTLILLNFRPEYSAEWMQRSHYQQIALHPLGPEDMEELLDHLLGNDSSTAELRTRIVERTAGNPFFVEEVVYSLADSGSLHGERGAYALVQPMETLAIPDSVQTILAARIDRLVDTEKRVLQTAAVIGSEFPLQLLDEVMQRPFDLESALSGLVQRELLHPTAIYPDAEYAFRHPLIQEVAYATQLGERRAEIHAATARALERIYPEQLDERAHLIARHLEEASEWLDAARWRARAAAWTQQQDPRESFTDWKAVLALVERSPESEEAKQLSLRACRWGLEMAWRVAADFEEADPLFERGCRVAVELGDQRALAALHFTYASQAYQSGREDGERRTTEALALAREVGASGVAANVLNSVATNSISEGDLERACDASERCIELCDGDVMLGVKVRGFSPLCLALGERAQAYAFLGRLEEAERDVKAAFELCEEHDLLESQIMAARAGADLALARGEAGLARERSLVFLELAERFGNTAYRAGAVEVLARALLLDGRPHEAIAPLEDAMALYEQSLPGLHYRLGARAALARALADAGQTERAVALSRESLGIVTDHPNARLGTLEVELEMAHVLIVSDAANFREEIERRLDLVEAGEAEMGSRHFGPLAQLELAQLAKALGDGAAEIDALRVARDAFAAINASGHVARIERALGSDR